MDDRIRASDADRERVTARLRDHFAEGRLSQAEMDERVTAALNAKTLGDLRPLTRDLPEPAPAAPAGQAARWAGPPFPARRRGPRLLPVLLLLLLLTVAIPHGGWVLLGVANFFLFSWLFVMLAGAVVFSLVRGRIHRSWQAGDSWSGHRPPHWR
jgi:Domain of unknown function (DUF1707)